MNRLSKTPLPLLTLLDKRKKHAARLINEDSLLEFDLAVPSIKKESLPPNVEGGAPFYYGDTLCLAGGYNTNDSLLLKDVDCWNPLQGKYLLSFKNIYDRCPKSQTNLEDPTQLRKRCKGY